MEREVALTCECVLWIIFRGQMRRQQAQLSGLGPVACHGDFSPHDIKASQLKLAFGLSLSSVYIHDDLAVIRHRAQQLNSVALKSEAFSGFHGFPLVFNRRLSVDLIYDLDQAMCRLFPGARSRN